MYAFDIKCWLARSHVRFYFEERSTFCAQVTITYVGTYFYDLYTIKNQNLTIQ